MTFDLPSAMTRRRLLALSGAAALPGCAAAAAMTEAAAGTALVLRAAPAAVAMRGTGGPATAVLAYNGAVAGPVVEMHQAVPFRATVRNGLDQGTTVHWHGIRLPNAMDGVPGISQPPIRPGADFRYGFTPPDAGTFWYHPHDHTAHQMGRGLAGALIVREAEPPAFDRDVLWVLQDWAFDAHDQFVPGFDTPMEAMMSGRIGSVVTINGRIAGPVALRAGERLRLRLVNACLARFMALRFGGHRVRVVALDGQPVVEPFEPADGRVVIAPAQRVDLQLDAIGAPGASYPVVDDFYGGRSAYRLVSLAYTSQSALRTVAAAPVVLPANPVPRPDLRNPIRHRLDITGGMMGGMGMAADGRPAPIWGIDDGDRKSDGMAPILTVPLGRTAVLTLVNHTSFWHPMHLHGYSYNVLSRNGVAARHPHLRDTVIVRPKERVEIAFVADNPGDWMLHCHVIEHQSNGLMTVIRVA